MTSLGHLKTAFSYGTVDLRYRREDFSGPDPRGQAMGIQ